MSGYDDRYDYIVDNKIPPITDIKENETDDSLYIRAYFEPEPELPEINYYTANVPELERSVTYRNPIYAPNEHDAFWPRLSIFGVVYEKHKNTAKTEDILNLVDQIYDHLLFGKQ